MNTTTSASSCVPPEEPSVRTRAWSRLECDGNTTQVTIRVRRGKVQEGFLDDKSLGGLGVYVAHGEEFHVGQVVTVEYNLAPVRAVIRRIEKLEDGLWRLGLAWQDDQPNEAT